MIKKIAFLLCSVMLSLTLSACAVEPLAGSAPGTGSSQPAAGMTADVRHILSETDDFLITVDTVDFESPSECCITVTCENKSGIDLLFYCARMTINGWQENVSISETVSAGRRSTIELYTGTYDYLHSFGDAVRVYNSVDRLSFDFEVADANNLSAQLLDETLTAYVSDVSSEEIEICPRITTETETVAADNEDFAFVVHGVYDLSGEFLENYYMVHCYAENKTDKPLEIEWNNTCINGWMVDPHYYARISPHSRMYSIVIFDLDAYTRAGIHQLDSIHELTFEVRAFYQSDEECFDAARETAVIYPAGMPAEDAPLPQRVPVPGEQIIADGELFTLIADPVIMPFDDTYCMGIYVHNKSETEIHLSVSESSINGQRGNYHFGNETILPGQRVYHLVTIDGAELARAGAETPETIGCRVQILNNLRAGIFSEQVNSSFEQ